MVNHECSESKTASPQGDIPHVESTSDHCSDDAPLMAIAALSAVDGVMFQHSLLNLVHLNGLIAVLKSRPPRGPVSEMSRRICEHYLCDVYVAAVMRGVASPFESLNTGLYRLDERYAGSADMRLRAIGNELTVRLPRLILLVRKACHLSNSELDGSFSNAWELANELSTLRDDSSESAMLHGVRVINTTGEQDCKAIKFCYQYNRNRAFRAGVIFWFTRAALLRLRLRLCSHQADSCSTLSVQLASELQQCVSNLVMSAPYARRLALRTIHRMFAHIMLVCWGGLRDCPEAVPRCAKDSEALFAWLLANANRSHPTDAPMTSTDMDRMAETFAGGPLECWGTDACGGARVASHSSSPAGSNNRDPAIEGTSTRSNEYYSSWHNHQLFVGSWEI